MRSLPSTTVIASSASCSAIAMATYPFLGGRSQVSSLAHFLSSACGPVGRTDFNFWAGISCCSSQLLRGVMRKGHSSKTMGARQFLRGSNFQPGGPCRGGGVSRKCRGGKGPTGTADAWIGTILGVSKGPGKGQTAAGAPKLLPASGRMADSPTECVGLEQPEPRPAEATPGDPIDVSGSHDLHTPGASPRWPVRLWARFCMLVHAAWHAAARNLQQVWGLHRLIPRFLVVIGQLALVVALTSAMIQAARPARTPTQEISYSLFLDQAEARQVKAVVLEEGSNRLLFTMRPHPPGVQSQETAIPVTTSETVPGGSVVIPAGHVAPAGTSVQEAVADTVPKPRTIGRAKVVLDALLAATPGGAPVDATPASKDVSVLKAGTDANKASSLYMTRRPANDVMFLLPFLREVGVPFSSVARSPTAAITQLAGTILALWIPLAPVIYLAYRQLGNGSGGRKKAKPKHSVRFADVAGVDEAKAELLEIVQCLQGAAQYKALGAKLPRGVLLVGPPGTGKTLLARAVAGEAGVPFFATSASEFVEMFVGRGAARIRHLFAEARAVRPSIVFIDELDAVGGRRGATANDERDQTLNQLLTEMDGFEGDTGVLVLAATNRVEALDPALCRPGRISRQVAVGLPTASGRQAILAVHMRDTPLEGDPEIIRGTVSAITRGFAGADLANVVNEASLLAARDGRAAVRLADLTLAVDRAKYGSGSQSRGGIKRIMERKLASWLEQSATRLEKDSKELPPGGLTPPVRMAAS